MGILSTSEKESIRIRASLMTLGPKSELTITTALQGAVAITKKTLGEKWVEKNILAKADEKQSDFMNRGLRSERERLVYVDRTIYLAEFLDRLCCVPGFDTKIRDLQTKSLQETFFELEVAYSLHSRSSLIEFVVPTKTKGEDYDLAAKIGNSRISVEVKCRTASDAFDGNKLKSPLKHAARVQLPKEGSNVIYFRIPAAWATEPNLIAQTDRVLKHFLQDYSRINLVVLWWEEWWIKRGSFARTSRFKTYVNPRPKTYVENIETIITNVSFPRIGRTHLGISFI